MKALYIVEPHRAEVRDIPMPAIGAPDEVLVKVMYAGICGSDMHNLHGHSVGIAYPIIAAHEMSGQVVDFGSEVRGLEIGDHVIMNPVTACGYCYPCSIGRSNVCENLKARGAHQNGCMCEYIILKRNTVHKISKDIPWQQAALVEPYTITGQCTSRAGVTAGDTVYIVGAGPIGIAIMEMCKLLGALTVISDTIPERLDRAKKLGADYTVNLAEESAAEALKKLPIHGVTVAIDAAGAPSVIPELIRLVLPAARIVCMGFNQELSPVSLVDVTKKEITLLGSRLSMNQFDRIIKLFEEGRLDGRGLISGVYDLKDAPEAFRVLDENKCEHCKVLIRIGE